MKTLIIQTSPVHTASTVLVNGLYGMIPELSHMNVIGVWDCNDEYHCDEETFEDYIALNTPNDFEDIVVVKSHNTYLDYYMAKYSYHYDIYFVSSERKEKNVAEYMIPEEYRNYDNLILFDYEEINETEDYSVEDIVNCMYDKLSKTILNLNFSKSGGVDRIRGMNKRYQEIKDRPFDYLDEFYHIHGSHRNRVEHTPDNPHEFGGKCKKCGYNYPAQKKVSGIRCVTTNVGALNSFCPVCNKT